jgi:hypothetical protein
VAFALFFSVAKSPRYSEMMRRPLGQIALGQSGQHLHEIAQRLRDIVAQSVDQGADVEHKAGLAFQREIKDWSAITQLPNQPAYMRAPP